MISSQMNSMILAMYIEAKNELYNEQKYNGLFYLKRFAKFLLYRECNPIKYVNWPSGLLVKGIMAYYSVLSNQDQLRDIEIFLKKYYDTWIAKGCHIYCLDDVICGESILDLYYITKDKKYKKASEKMANFLLQHKKDEIGNLIYRPNQKNEYIFADSIGMICPFLCKYGVKYENKYAVTLALTQIQNFLQYGMDERTGLPYHGYEYRTSIKHGIIGWGRAVGWIMLGISGCLECLKKTSDEYIQLQVKYIRMLDCVKEYQLDNGIFTWQLTAMEGPIDTSGSAMILQAIANSIKNNDVPECYKQYIVNGVNALKGYLKNGRVHSCLAECEGFSMYPQKYGTYAWSLGPTLSLFCKADI